VNIEGLRSRISGDVVAPEDPNWNEARVAWNLAVDQRPALVALPESADDVIEIVEYAREHGHRIAPQGTGHNAGPLGPMPDTVLMKTERMRGVDIDPERSQARVEAGVLWAEVTEAAAEHGLTALAGSSPDVGVVGYTLGGGVSWLGRKHGLAANSVTAIELVTADHGLIRADAENHPELFWALRGGGGSFGVVTAIEFRLYPVRELYAGAMFWPMEDADRILNAWRAWVDDVPDEVTSVGRLLRVPPFPDIPEPIRGRSFVVVEAAYLGSEADGAELVAPLRALEPELDTFSMIPVTALSKLHMDPEHPVPGAGDGIALQSVTRETVAAVVEAAGAESGAPLLSVEIRHLGGALARSGRERGALDRMEAEFLSFAVGMAPDASAKAAVHQAIRRVQSALAPWEARHMYLNFSDQRKDVRRLFPFDVYRRLAVTKARWDAGELFKSNHPIPPATIVSRRPRRALVRRAPGRAARPAGAAR
jgi:hypothetical protein